MKKISSIALALALSTSGLAISQSFTDSANAQDFKAFEYREIGPTRGGRVTAVAGTVAEDGTFYLGATGGGVWKSTDYGTSWHNVSDGYFASPSIGDIAVSQNDPNVLYVGTGTDGLRSNIIAGKGMYKSIDGGETWDHIGLTETGHIGAVEIDPRNNNIAYVAAIGQAFNANEERGLYKTTDGGKSWQKILYISDEVGISDVEMVPNNPDILFATAWKAKRTPWTIISGGNQDEGGVYKSIDGGENWVKLDDNGLPTGLIGKIDLAVSPADSSVVAALVEAPGDVGGLYMSYDQGKTFEHVSNEGGIRTRPFYYANVDLDPTDANIVYVMATGYYKSTNGGKKWQRLRPPHGDSHDMWIHPEKPNMFIQANDGGANVTFNGGQTWTSQFNQPTAELYTVEADDQYPYWLYAGQQDNSTTIAVPSNAPYGSQHIAGWIMETGGCETGPAVPKPGNHNIVYANCKGRFGVYDKRTGVEKSYYVGAANLYGHNPKDLKHRFQRVAPIHVSPHNADVVYHGSQYVHRTTDDGVTWETISPDLTANDPDKQVISGAPITRDITGEEYYSTLYSIRESSIAAGVIWTGSNDGVVAVTRDNGETWNKVTPRRLPEGGRVDSVEPSPHDAATAYISVLRYQLGDWKPYIYKTDDYGRSWDLLTNGRNGIPSDHPVRVVREDPERQGLLYAGTEYGMFISMDDGETWKPFQQNLPVTPVTDLKRHRDDLVMTTMGRGFWVLDNVTTMHQASFGTVDAGQAALFKPADTIRYRMPKGRWGGSDSVPQYPRPSVIIDYQIPTGFKGAVKMDILDSNGTVVNTFVNGPKVDDQVINDMNLSSTIYIVNPALSTKPGINRFHWDMSHQGPWDANPRRAYSRGAMVTPGDYTVRLTVGDKVMSESFSLKPNPTVVNAGTSVADIEEQTTLALKVTDLLSEGRMLVANLQKELKDGSTREAQVKAALEQLTAKRITYPQPKIVDQMGYLYFQFLGADQKPGGDMVAQYENLKAQFEAVKASLN